MKRELSKRKNSCERKSKDELKKFVVTKELKTPVVITIAKVIVNVNDANALGFFD